MKVNTYYLHIEQHSRVKIASGQEFHVTPYINYALSLYLMKTIAVTIEFLRD